MELGQLRNICIAAVVVLVAQLSKLMFMHVFVVPRFGIAKLVY